MTFRIIAIAVAATAVVALLWIGGELHRANCLRDGRTGCSVMVWKDGKPKPPKRCTRFGCASDKFGGAITTGERVRPA